MHPVVCVKRSDLSKPREAAGGRDDFSVGSGDSSSRRQATIVSVAEVSKNEQAGKVVK